MNKPTGFIGLGVMGTPMALNLARSGVPLVVWSRSNNHYDTLRAAGAEVAESLDALFSQCETLILMLAHEAAIDEVLGRHTPLFEQRMAGRLIVNMSTTSSGYSRLLADEIGKGRGQYVEAPVSGSRKPAEAGQLVVMLAGMPEPVEAVRSLIQPLCRDSLVCGDVPGALTMKLAVNLFLITMVTGLAEATHFAQRQGVDLAQFAQALNVGPMASDVSRGKLGKLVAQDFSVQAAITDVLKNSRLVAQAARDLGIASPLLDVCHALYGETEALGQGGLDMVAVIHAIAQRTAQADGSP
ncbi:NAD(P)-dependent oxidoreductase [Pseudomonas vanderleydeniana]|uniref:NAD(P)-dependent oxidoreductase n=1 Tax=Pseudomonas vanderleydeniana TaxID=2745495 RepID=A0A9E6PHV8_9PSED|nr:NAD(P)-dependent oxidoreductase [Pseudomonas vanderleydeniana]QXI26393.1 NAD(P)-dependent oxidoreductase [Pseudomonas vanderleydeniana]